MSRRERIVEVAAHIKQLRSKLSAYEAELDKLLVETKSGGSTVEPRSSLRSIWSRLLAHLEENATTEFNAPQLAEALHVPNINSIRGTLSRLVAEGKIAKSGRGLYSALREHEAEDEREDGEELAGPTF